MNSNTSYKPSPLSFNSPRASPFRRPSSPGSPTTAIRASTPTSSPGRGPTPVQSPSKLNQSYTVGETEEAVIEEDNQAIPSPRSPRFREPPASPTKNANNGRGSFSSLTPSRMSRPNLGNTDTLSKLPPAQLRDMREAFQVLDRDNDGNVDRDDVADVLSNLGISCHSSIEVTS